MKKLLTVLLVFVLALCLVNLNSNNTKAEDNAKVKLLKGDDFKGALYLCAGNNLNNIKHIVFENVTEHTGLANTQNVDFADQGNAKAGYESSTNTVYIYGSIGGYLFNEDCSHMFADCVNLIDINFNNLIDTSSVSNFKQMFEQLTSIKYLDLSSFVTNPEADYSNMFYNDGALKTIFVKDGQFSISPGFARGSSMFYGCNSLVGGNGTKYNSSYQGDERSKIDKEGQAGYLTDKNNGPIYCDGIRYYTDGKWYNGEIKAANELSKEQLALYGISYDQDTKTVTLSKSLTSDGNYPTFAIRTAVDNVVLNNNIKIVSGSYGACFGLNDVNSTNIYGNGHTLEVVSKKEDGLSAFGYAGTDATKVLTLDNIKIIATAKNRSHAIVNISKALIKNGTSMVIKNTDQGTSNTTSALSSKYGINHDGFEMLGSIDSEGTNLLVPSNNHTGSKTLPLFYSVNIGTKDAPEWQNAKYIQITPKSTPTPSPKKDESCEKVIGPTWHWNNDKGICEEYATVGTSTR